MMPILQRIELANFMNSQRKEIWLPDWPHQIFELNGENAALNIPNGKGKSTMVTGILAMLTYHGRSLKDIRTRFFAPTHTRHFTHIRIQVLIPMPGARGDLVTDAGGEHGGQPMVFGMYGYAGENEKLDLYAYQGTFEDCPVAIVHNLHHTPIKDDVFLGQLKTCHSLFPSNHKERSKRAWQVFVEDFFDVASLKQQLNYQLLRGAEGGHSYFEVKPPVGMNYSAAIFYERLAPELLTDVMGDLGEDGEHGIEDTIHEKVSKVIAARRETERKAEELSRSGNTLRELEGLLSAAAALGSARQEYLKHQTRLSVELAVLQNVVLTDPIPGVPKVPPDGIPEISKAMVMHDGKWYLPDRMVAEFGGEASSHVNERAHRNGLALVQASRSQLVDFPCDSFHAPGKRGPAGSLYTRDSAIGLLQITSNFTRAWTRESAIDAVTRAFDWVEAYADTNPARRLSVELNGELQNKEGEQKALSERYRALQDEKDDLITEQSTVGAQQAEHRRMGESGLFSADEMKAPAQTGRQAIEQFSEATKNLEAHRSQVLTLKPVHNQWKDFVQEYGERITPAQKAEELTAARKRAEDVLTDAKSALTDARRQRKALEDAKRKADAALREIDGKLARFLETFPATVIFAEHFGTESPVGLEQKVIHEHNMAKERLAQIAQERSAYRGALDALAQYQRTNSNAAPEDWLRARLVKWDTLGSEISGLQKQLADAKRRLAAFDDAVVVAGRVAHEAAAVAGGKHMPLHEAIARMQLDDAQCGRALTLFSALLHTPVYDSVAEAAEAAQRLAAAEIEVPVFVRDELEAFCKAGTITADTLVAHTWLVGVRTRQVDCLLDPTLVEREKAAEQQRITTLTATMEAKNTERAQCSPEDEAAAQARSASEALRNGYPDRDADLATEAEGIAKKLPSREQRASPDMLEVLRKTVKHRKEFEGTDEASLRDKHAAADLQRQQADEALSSNDELIQTLESNADKARDRVGEATIQASMVADLGRIQQYIDHPEHNPAFMEAAEALEHTLVEKANHADKRTRFQFELAEQFAKKGYERPRQIESRLQEIKEEQRDIQEKTMPALNNRIEAIRGRLLPLFNQVNDVDDFARRLIARYRSFAAEQDDLVSVTQEQIARHPLWGSAEALREEQGAESLISMLKDVDADILYEDTAEVGKERLLAKSSFEKAKSAFTESVDRMLVTADLDISEHVRIELQRSKEKPELVEHLHAVAKMNYEKNQAANATATSYLEGEWENLGKWLKSFTLRLPDNLSIMKNVFGPVKDRKTGQLVGAGFEIEATLVNQDDIKVILDEVVRKVEKFETTRHAIEDAAPALRDQAMRGIRTEIRSTFYQKVITNAKIRVFMPSISMRPLALEKNMVSTGQGVAMTLLWIVKMADYITERELRRMTTNRVQQKHLRPSQFALMDGAFSSLSNKDLIRDALDSIKRTRGRFQLIITDHDENYRNNFEYFPTLIEAREVNGQFMYADSKTRRVLQPEEAGSHYGAMGTMSLRVQPIEATGAPS